MYHRAFHALNELSNTFKSSGLKLVPCICGAERQSCRAKCVEGSMETHTRVQYRSPESGRPHCIHFHSSVGTFKSSGLKLVPCICGAERQSCRAKKICWMMAWMRSLCQTLPEIIHVNPVGTYIPPWELYSHPRHHPTAWSDERGAIVAHCLLSRARESTACSISTPRSESEAPGRDQTCPFKRPLPDSS
jgi:hypothetical protein